MTILQHWIPAFAGMTSRTMPFSSHSCRRSRSRAWTGSRRVPLSSPHVGDEL